MVELSTTNLHVKEYYSILLPIRTYNKSNVNIDWLILMESVILGGGCFWCIEAPFSEINGIISIKPGYAGGDKENPTYREVCTEKTGHAEVVMIEFDPTIIKLELILEIFFTIHDPTQLNQQGNDIGTQYRSCIFVTHESHYEIIEEQIKKAEKLWGKKIVTTIEKLNNFWIAELEHHNYFFNNPNQPYCQAIIIPKIVKAREKYHYLYNNK